MRPYTKITQRLNCHYDLFSRFSRASIQGDSRLMFNILEVTDSIGHCEKKKVHINMCLIVNGNKEKVTVITYKTNLTCTAVNTRQMHRISYMFWPSMGAIIMESSQCVSSAVEMVRCMQHSHMLAHVLHFFFPLEHRSNQP